MEENQKKREEERRKKEEAKIKQKLTKETPPKKPIQQTVYQPQGNVNPTYQADNAPLHNNSGNTYVPHPVSINIPGQLRSGQDSGNTNHNDRYSANNERASDYDDRYEKSVINGQALATLTGRGNQTGISDFNNTFATSHTHNNHATPLVGNDELAQSTSTSSKSKSTHRTTVADEQIFGVPESHHDSDVGLFSPRDGDLRFWVEGKIPLLD